MISDIPVLTHEGYVVLDDWTGKVFLYNKGGCWRTSTGTRFNRQGECVNTCVSRSFHLRLDTIKEADPVASGKEAMAHIKDYLSRIEAFISATEDKETVK